METYKAAEHLEEGDVLPTHNSSEVSETANGNGHSAEVNLYPENLVHIGHSAISHVESEIDPVTKSTEIDLTPDITLKTGDQQCEKAILFLLATPDLTITGDDVSGDFYRSIGVNDEAQRRNMRIRLRKLGVINAVKSPDHSRRFSEISLDPNAVVDNSDKKFVTPRVLKYLKEADLGIDTSVLDRLIVMHNLRASEQKRAAKQRQSEGSRYSEDGASEKKRLKYKPNDMRFDFRVANGLYQRKVGHKEFAKKAKPVKMIIAVGHASTFKQNDEDYKRYIRLIANKGLPEDQLMSMEKIDAELKKLVDEGYAQNGGLRYRLTHGALELLQFDSRFYRAGGPPLSPRQKAELNRPEHAAMTQEEGKLVLVKTYSLPSIMIDRILENEKDETKDKTQDELVGEDTKVETIQVKVLDEKQNEKNKKIVKAIGYRALETLAELELAKGVINSSDGNFANEIRERAETAVGNDSYKTALEYLAAKKAIVFSKDNKSVSLTDYGVNLISLVKAYPDMYRMEMPKRFNHTTTRQIIEHVLDEVGITLSHTDLSTDLPETSPWYTAENEDLSMSWKIAGALDKPEDNIARRLYDMRMKGLIEMEVSGSDLSATEITKRARITKAGMQFDIEAQKASRLADEVTEEAIVEEAEELREACMNYASTLNKKRIYKNLDKQRHSYSLFELNPEEFAEERKRLERLFSRLRKEYRKQNPFEAAA